MDWVALLKSQQEDFIHRLKSEHFLSHRFKGVFGESFVVNKNKAIPLIQSSEKLAEKLQETLDNHDNQLTENIFKNKLIKYCVNLSFGDLLVEVNPEQHFLDDFLILALKDNHNFRIIVKLVIADSANIADFADIKWFFTPEEVKSNQIVLCVFSGEDLTLNKSQYKIIFAGFLPTYTLNISKKQNRFTFSFSHLLYMGGLKFYLTSYLDQKYDYLKQASLHNNHGDYLSAIYCYDQVLKNNSIDYKVYLLRAIAKWKIGSQQGALADLNQAIIIYPKYDLAYHWRGYIKYKIQSYQEAIFDYTEEIKINPLSIYAYYRRALCYEKTNSLLKAFEDYSQVLILNNNLYQGFYNRGNIRYELGDKEGALEDYRKALQLNPSLAKAYYNLAIIYNDLGEINQAIYNYKLAINLVPNYVKAYYNLAIIYVDLGKYRQAIIHYDKACELDNEFIQAKYNKQFLLEYLRQEKQNKYNLEYNQNSEGKSKFKKPEQFTPEITSDLLPEKGHSEDEKNRIVNNDVVKVLKENNFDKMSMDPWNTKPR